jgi:hypothetical protein
MIVAHKHAADGSWKHKSRVCQVDVAKGALVSLLQDH